MDISELSLAQKEEIASYIQRDNLGVVNKTAQPCKVRDTFYTRYVKRVFDVAISMLLLLVTAPLNLVLAAITYLDVGAPIIFKQQRIGRGGQPFPIYKFRNMTNAVDANNELLPPEQRVTKWGRIARKTSLDELLNFVSILKGDMSIIGPRPLLDCYATRLSERHKGIYEIRPGLECPTLKAVDHALSWQERLENYVWYAEHCSFGVDFRLALRMFSVAFNHKETERRAKAAHGGFMGYGLDGNAIDTKNVPDCFVEEYCAKYGYADLREAIPRQDAGSVIASKEKKADEQQIDGR